MNMKKVFSFLFLGVASVGLQASDVFLEVEGHSKVEFSSGSGYVAVDESREQMKRLLQKIKSQKSGVITEEIEGIVLPLIRDYQNSPAYHRENYRDIPFGSFSDVLRVKTLKILDELVEPYLRKTITKTQGTDGEINARYLLDEISVAKNRDTMTLNKAQNIIPRLLLSMSVLSEDERVVMEAAVGITVYRNFF